MKYGSKPTVESHKDYDLIRTFGALTSPKFPDSYDVDANIWIPDQNVPQSVLGGIPALPYGCTEYTTADLDNDLSGKLQSNPNILENVFHASAQGGADVRTMLMNATAPTPLHPERLGWLGNIFNIRAQGLLDWFDAMRYAMLQGGFEKRAISWGTPWFPSWEAAALDGKYVMPMPTDQEFKNARTSIGWHNSKFSGWELVDGKPMLRNKSWQGTHVGKNGWIVFPREVVNAVMTINGTCAFTASNFDGDIKRVSLPVVQMILSYLRSMMSFAYGGTQTMLWDTPAHCRRNVRVIADEMGLTWNQKNTLCATIHGESNWNTKAICINRRKDGSVASTDRGLCQWNDYYHGSEITPDEAINNPEKAVRIMCSYWKAGLQNQWVAYLNKSYLKYLPMESLPSTPY